MDQEDQDELLGFLSGPQERSGEGSDQALLEDALREEGEERPLMDIMSEAGLFSELLNSMS